jgi:general secretion pathway protein G
MIARLRALSKGSSLLELLSLATMIGIIVVCMIPHIGGAAERERQAFDQQNRNAIDMAIERWYLATGQWPKEDLTDLAADSQFLPEGLPRSPITGKYYTLHPETKTAQ